MLTSDGDVFGLHLLELFHDEDRARCIARDTNIDDEYYELKMIFAQTILKVKSKLCKLRRIIQGPFEMEGEIAGRGELRNSVTPSSLSTIFKQQL